MLFETKDCKIEAEQKEGCLLAAVVTLSKESVQNLHKKAIKSINKEISIPGFRKGKVPDDAVLKKFGGAVEQEWKEAVVNEAIEQTIVESKIYPFTRKSIHKPKIDFCSLEEGAKVSFSYEHYPLIPVIDFSQIFLPKVTIQVATDQEVNDVLEEICESHAVWHEIQDRPVAEGDYVDLTLEAVEGDSLRPIANERRFHVVPKKMGGWMRQGIVGKAIGDIIQEESQPDEDASADIIANFKKTIVKITIHKIFQAELPELNDEFAIKLGAPSLDALKERIIQDLNQESVEKQKEERFEALKLHILEKYPFDLPQSLVNEENKERTEIKIRNLRKQNLSEEDIKAQVNTLAPTLLDDSKKAIRLYFLTRQIANQGKLEVTNEELNLFLPRFNLKNIRELPENILNNLSNMLMQRKIKEYALAQVPA